MIIFQSDCSCIIYHFIICVYGDNNIQFIKHKKSLQYFQTDSRSFIYILSGIFHMFKIEVKAKNKAKITRGAYYKRKYECFGILRAKVGVRIIRGCVLYAENYGM